MITASITSKGQITIPKAVRDALGLEVGQQVLFLIEGKRAYLRPIPSRGISALRGIAQGLRPFPGSEAERRAARHSAVSEALGSDDESAGTDAPD
jgi:antitoxin PrlF